jgi:hypothetical protein
VGVASAAAGLELMPSGGLRDRPRRVARAPLAAAALRRAGVTCLVATPSAVAGILVAWTHSTEVSLTGNVPRGGPWLVILVSRRKPRSLRQSWRERRLPTSELGVVFTQGRYQPLLGSLAQAAGGIARDLTGPFIRSDGNAVYPSKACPGFRGLALTYRPSRPGRFRHRYPRLKGDPQWRPL